MNSIILGKYTYGGKKYEAIINLDGERNEYREYFNRLTEGVQSGLYKNSLQLNENEFAKDFIVEGNTVFSLDKRNNVIYGKWEQGVRKMLIPQLTEEETERLNDIVDRYDEDELNTAIDEVFDNENNAVVSDKEAICDFIMRLEGYAVRLKELHWSAEKKAQHELTEKAYNLVYNLEDSIAEDMMGYLGTYIEPNTITPVLPEDSNQESLFHTILKDAHAICKLMENNENCIGIKSEMESFIHEMNNIIYLGKMV